MHIEAAALYAWYAVYVFALGKVDWPECAQIDVRRCDLCAPPSGGQAGSWESIRECHDIEKVK